MSRMSAGMAVVECLRVEGVRHVFGIIGSSYLEVLDAFHDQRDIDFISVRHEQAAAHMADAYARVTGGIGVCMAQNGPGASNLVTGIALAKQAFSPVLSIAGAAMTTQNQRDSFQEIDQLSLFRPITKEALRVTRGDRTAEIMRHAIRVALAGQRGPVHIDLARDILREEADFAILPCDSYRPTCSIAPSSEAVMKAVTLLRQAVRPLIVAGGGVKWSRATKQLVVLAEVLEIPVVTSSGHRDVMPNDHPLFFGQLGPRGSTLAKQLAQKADVIFALGCRLGFTTTMYGHDYINREAKIIQSDIEAREIGRLYPVAVSLVGDAGLIAEACAAEGRKQFAHQLRSEWKAWSEEERRSWSEKRTAGIRDDSVPIRTDRFYAELRRVMPKDIHVTIDAGYWGNMATDAFDHFCCPTLFTPLDYGCLGFSFPAALGVKFARPEVPVISINGDGGFAMNMQELETAVRCRLNPVVLVLNNFAWGVEKSYQRDFFEERYVGANIGNPRFDRLAEAFGARGARVEHAAEIGEAVKEALSSDLPTVIDVIVDPSEISGLRRDAVRPRKRERSAT